MVIVCVACSLVIVLLFLGYEAIQQASKTAQKVSQDALESQAKTHLMKLTVETAERRRLELEKTMVKAKWIAAATGEIFSSPERYLAVGKQDGPVDLIEKPARHHVDGPREKASIHVPRHVQINDEIREQIQLSRALDPLANAVLNGDKKTTAVYLVTDQEICRYYPKCDLNLPPAMNFRTSIGRKKTQPFVTQNATPFWTDVYVDATGLGKMVTATAPISLEEGKVTGVISMDFLLDDIGMEIESSVPVNGAYSFMLDGYGKPIAFPDAAYRDLLGRTKKPNEEAADLTELSSEINDAFIAMTKGAKGLVRIKDERGDRIVAYAPLEGVGWSLATVVSTKEIFAEVNSLNKTLTEDAAKYTFLKFVPVGLIFLAAFSAIASLMIYRFTSPLRQLTSAAEAITQGDWDVEIPVQGSDEVGVLSKALATMTTQMQGLVAERTAELSSTMQQLEKTSEQLKYQAHHDELTGLRNRRGFAEEIERQLQSDISRRQSHLMLLDLDRFKVVNDTCGHAEGDRLLCEVSCLIQESLCQDDLMARIGGDEFAILLRESSEENAITRAESIRKTIQDYEFYSSSSLFKIGASIGLVSLDGHSLDLEEIQKLADTACYAAKEGGRNRVHVSGIKDDLVEGHRGEMRWVQRLQDAMDNDRFVLFGQKIQPLDPNDKTDFVEVLLRLQDTNSDKIILPDAFFPAAERFELLVDIDRWVVNRLLYCLKNDRHLGSNKRYWVNLSGASIGDKKFSSFLIDSIKRSDLPAGTVNFEITETVVIRSMGVAQQLLSQLSELGCEISLDDFGSGLSSLMYLKALQADYLKIDGNFIKDIITDDVNSIFVKSTIDIAHLSGIKTIAEYVETDEIRKIVQSLGADYAQGFGIGVPAPLFESQNQSVTPNALYSDN